MTGIDRVEFEYLNALLADHTPLFGLVRLTLGYAVLDRAGVAALAERLAGRTDWGSPDLIARGSRKLPPLRRRAEAEVRRLAIRKFRRAELGAHLSDLLSQGSAYLNVGHSNIDARVMHAVRGVADATIAVLIHDTIPLDFPEFQRPATASHFANKFRLMIECADLVICPSQATRRDIERHVPQAAKLPNLSVAHLGVRSHSPTPDALPENLHTTAPYFVALGTIEPRKNHALLLDVWDQLSKRADPPQLFVVGQRGWNNDAVFRRLDRRPANVTEINDLPDGAVWALLDDATGLLFPTLSEGFGLPAAEATALGIPVICNDLPVFREVLGDYPIYAEAPDLYSWETKITELADNSEMVNNRTVVSRQRVDLPTWKDHFNLVLRLT